MTSEDPYPERKTDVLVIGAGLAGRMAALTACSQGASVLMVSKGASASPKITGFSAVITPGDSVEQFILDTCEAGCWLNEESLVERLAQDANGIIRTLEKLGLTFSHENGSYHLNHSLGHTCPRLVHSDMKTGERSMVLLMNHLHQEKVQIRTNQLVYALLKDGDRVTGALLFDQEQSRISVISAKAVILATGGGHIAQGSTYPVSQTGDGMILAFQAGAELIDLEFIQHEPCRCLPIYGKTLGLSTTLLAKGGSLLNGNKNRFVFETGTDQNLPDKDRLSVLIAQEIKAGRGTQHGGIFVDLTALPEEELTVHHRPYFERFMAAGIDLRKTPVEVAPAAHTLMGGILIDSQARTGVKGLYAAGEVTGGLHGASRLGGNAGTEVYVFGSIAGREAAGYASKMAFADNMQKLAQEKQQEMTRKTQGTHASHDIQMIKNEVRQIVSHSLGPIREKRVLNAALGQCRNLSGQLSDTNMTPSSDLPEFIGTRNLLILTQLMCQAALERKESRGAHFRADFPERDNRWLQHICFSEERGMITKLVQNRKTQDGREPPHDH